MKKIAVKLVILLFLNSTLISLGYSYPPTPFPEMTSGELCTESDDDFFERRYQEGIPYCKRNVSFKLKQKIYDDYGIDPKDRKEYTIDHLLPLSIGGSNGIKNLWPEHKEVKKLRPLLELNVFKQLRDGKINQKQAIEIILKEKFNLRIVNPKNVSCFLTSVYLN